MKIKKLVESKLIEAEDKIDATGSVQEIADDIQDQVDDLTNGELEISDEAAKKAAEDTSVVADVVNADEAVIVIDDNDWSDVKITNRLYRTLDRAFAAASTNMGKHKIKAGANVLVEGLPGSGKTAIVEAWCKMNGLTLVALNATDPKIESAINGIPLRNMSVEDSTELTYAYAVDDKNLGLLINEKHPELAGKCVLFVDELNRQKTEQLRRPFMSLFNEKRNASGTLDFSKNLLFCVVAINPFGNDFHDKGVSELNAAEKDRFARQQYSFDSNIDDALQFWNWYRSKELLELGIISPGSAASANHGGWVGPTKELDEDDLMHAKRVLKGAALALYILNNVQKSRETEVFTTRRDTDKAYRSGDYRYTTSRGLFDGIFDSTFGDDKSPVKDFLDWVDEESHYTPEKVRMFHDILDSYVMDVKGLFAAYNLDKTPKEIKAELDGTAAPKADTTVDSTDDEIEDDDVMFGADDISGVSKASTDDLSKDDVDSIMGSWL